MKRAEVLMNLAYPSHCTRRAQARQMHHQNQSRVCELSGTQQKHYQVPIKGREGVCLTTKQEHTVHPARLNGEERTTPIYTASLQSTMEALLLPSMQHKNDERRALLRPIQRPSQCRLRRLTETPQGKQRIPIKKEVGVRPSTRLGAQTTWLMEANA